MNRLSNGSINTKQKRFTSEAEAILYAQSKVRQYGKQATIIRLEFNGEVTYRVYHAKSKTTPFGDCRAGESFRPLGWVYSYQPDYFSKAPKDFYKNLNSKSESFNITSNGTLQPLISNGNN